MRRGSSQARAVQAYIKRKGLAKLSANPDAPDAASAHDRGCAAVTLAAPIIHDSWPAALLSRVWPETVCKTVTQCCFRSTSSTLKVEVINSITAPRETTNGAARTSGPLLQI